MAVVRYAQENHDHDFTGGGSVTVAPMNRTEVWGVPSWRDDGEVRFSNASAAGTAYAMPALSSGSTMFDRRPKAGRGGTGIGWAGWGRVADSQRALNSTCGFHYRLAFGVASWPSSGRRMWAGLWGQSANPSTGFDPPNGPFAGCYVKGGTLDMYLGGQVEYSGTVDEVDTGRDLEAGKEYVLTIDCAPGSIDWDMSLSCEGDTPTTFTMNGVGGDWIETESYGPFLMRRQDSASVTSNQLWLVSWFYTIDDL